MRIPETLFFSFQFFASFVYDITFTHSRKFIHIKKRIASFVQLINAQAQCVSRVFGNQIEKQLAGIDIT